MPRVNAFGLDLYARVRDASSNLVISPASVALALSMARAGARGTTASEMDAVLHDLATDDHAGLDRRLDAGAQCTDRDASRTRAASRRR